MSSLKRAKGTDNGLLPMMAKRHVVVGGITTMPDGGPSETKNGADPKQSPEFDQPPRVGAGQSRLQLPITPGRVVGWYLTEYGAAAEEIFAPARSRCRHDP